MDVALVHVQLRHPNMAVRRVSSGVLWNTSCEYWVLGVQMFLNWIKC